MRIVKRMLGIVYSFEAPPSSTMEGRNDWWNAAEIDISSLDTPTRTLNDNRALISISLAIYETIRMSTISMFGSLAPAETKPLKIRNSIILDTALLRGYGNSDPGRRSIVGSFRITQSIRQVSIVSTWLQTVATLPEDNMPHDPQHSQGNELREWNVSLP